ncbi:MAG: twin-arginine translocase TatA/TatE family subunit [Deltaproteobacteria bacterium]|nr:twin-arginine translocase TatA/TatE family subunit [Deltaproteobacteria bacterium]
MPFLGNIGPLELLVILLVVLLLFGRRLPELGTGLGKAISNFRHSYKEASNQPTVSDNSKKEVDSK